MSMLPLASSSGSLNTKRKKLRPRKVVAWLGYNYKWDQVYVIYVYKYLDLYKVPQPKKAWED